MVKTGFELLQEQINKKDSHIILGLDPTDDMQETIKEHGGLENYLKYLIDETHEYIVGVKPNLAFYERSPYFREIMAKVMDYASTKYNLVKILDVKRGDIMDTQGYWAKADAKNFKPDIVTLNDYMGGLDVVQPYLDLDEHVCAYVLAATSNPGARNFQDLYINGITAYQEKALQARKYCPDRVGFVVGATKPDAVKNIRSIEIEHGFGFAPVLAPGFGKQGGSLEFVSAAGNHTVYPISSALTNEKYLGGKTVKEAAASWRDNINAELDKPDEYESITKHVVNNMIKEDLILLPKTPEIATWPLLNKGKIKLKDEGIDIKGLSKEEQHIIFNDALDKNILKPTDFGSVFLQIRDVIGTTETRRLLAYLYAKLIKETGIDFARIGSVAYGAVNTGDLVSYFLDKPGLLLRKEIGGEATHSDILGYAYPGENIAMLEDVTTSADSLIKAINYLRELTGANYDHAFVAVKRTEEGEENCKKNGITLHYLMDMKRLLEYIYDSKSVDGEVKKLIKKYNA